MTLSRTERRRLLAALWPDVWARETARRPRPVLRDEGAFRFEDAFRFDLKRRDEANRALRYGIRQLAAPVWARPFAVKAAFGLSQDLERAGWPWQARALRAHASRVLRAPEGRATPPQGGGALASGNVAGVPR